jgi:hypothetical protein
MFLHELSRKITQGSPIRVDGEEYGKLVREMFNNECPYCSCSLATTIPVIEHLDGMNRYRLGLHVPGNVLVACRRCNMEKRRDDALGILSLAISGWESFLSHDGTHCAAACPTCRYWVGLWDDEVKRESRLTHNLERIRSFRKRFPELELTRSFLNKALPELVAKLYSDCQTFAESEIASLLERFDQVSTVQPS